MIKKTQDPIDLSTLEQMLGYISADQPREDWARILMAAKSEFGEAAKGIMQEWSATASNYKPGDFLATWKSIKSGGGITIASLVHEAKENGYTFAPITKADKQRLEAEKQAREAERQRLEAQEANQRQQGYKMARDKAQEIISGRAVWSNPEHGYYQNKGLSNSLNRLNRPLQFVNTLIVPVYQFKPKEKPVKRGEIARHVEKLTGGSQEQLVVDEWRKLLEVSSIQFIEADGTKRFLKGGQMKGGFFPVRFDGYVVKIVICEGVATGLTYAAVYDRTAEVICAFNARNLKAVARAFKLRYPMAQIVIAGDNDAATERKTGVNVGVVKAQEAAKAVDGSIHIPEFLPNESGTDWNDRFVLDYCQPMNASKEAHYEPR